MGREIRMVPKGWEHPKDERGEYKPLYDSAYEDAAAEWKRQFLAWENGERQSYFAESGQDYEFWDWDGMPPDKEYYRPKWTPEETTCFQMYETVSEGTPVSPVFETEDALVGWLVEQGHTEHAAREFVKQKWAPSMLMMVRHDGGPSIMASGVDTFDLPR